MRIFKNYLTLLSLTLLIVISSCQKVDVNQSPEALGDMFVKGEDHGKIIPGKYIVSFADNVVPESKFKKDMNYEERTAMVSNVVSDIQMDVLGSLHPIDQAYSVIFKGFAGSLTANQVELLLKDPRIKSVEPDRIVSLGKPEGSPGKGKKDNSNDEEQDPQTTPWGISRVNGGGSYNGSAVAWIIDSGIDLDHDDLNVDQGKSKSFLSGRDKNNPDDGNGHGTHVAGTVAAIDNDFGVIGVAPGATVVSVRVLDSRGNGSYSGVIAGVDYVGASASDGDVANLSLGGPANSTLDVHVSAAANQSTKKIHFCVAAGNDNDDAINYSPARTNTSFVYTVSAMTSSGSLASFSNYGSVVDYAEPGVGINSCWRNNGYRSISGTSMATPHLAGIMLMTNGSPYVDSYITGDKDNNADPIGEVN